MILKELPSGTIDLVLDGPAMLLQFNADCQDALPYCQAMCCRMISIFGPQLHPDEYPWYDTFEHPEKPKLKVLQWKPDGSCVYQEKDTGFCAIQESKPQDCQQWHCSPGGNKQDPKITKRDRGWLLTPRMACTETQTEKERQG